MVWNVKIIAVMVPMMPTDTFTTLSSRQMGISANRRFAISVSTRSLRSSQPAFLSLLRFPVRLMLSSP